MRLFSSIDISGSGLTAERLRMDVIANNIANANSTRTVEGGAYRRQLVVFVPREPERAFAEYLADAKGNHVGDGVRVVGIVKDPSPFKMVFDPSHPDANADGYVALPNVNIVSEMVDMISATRAYEANVTAINAAKSMAMKALEIGKG